MLQGEKFLGPIKCSEANKNDLQIRQLPEPEQAENPTMEGST
jgi:hypothetical protein